MLANLFSPSPHRPELLVWLSCWTVSTRVWFWCGGSAKQISLVSVFRICSLTAMQIQTPLIWMEYDTLHLLHFILCEFHFKTVAVLVFGIILQSSNSDFSLPTTLDFSLKCKKISPPPPPQAIWLQLTLDFLSTLIFHKNKSFSFLTFHHDQ